MQKSNMKGGRRKTFHPGCGRVEHDRRRNKGETLKDFVREAGYRIARRQRLERKRVLRLDTGGEVAPRKDANILVRMPLMDSSATVKPLIAEWKRHASPPQQSIYPAIASR